MNFYHVMVVFPVLVVIIALMLRHRHHRQSRYRPNTPPPLPNLNHQIMMVDVRPCPTRGGGAYILKSRTHKLSKVHYTLIKSIVMLYKLGHQCHCFKRIWSRPMVTPIVVAPLLNESLSPPPAAEVEYEVPYRSPGKNWTSPLH
jgi:hypothetical protein